MAVDLDLDLETLVGESESPCCENPEHAEKPQVHADGNEHYIQILFKCGHIKPHIKVSCEKWILFVTKHGYLICGECNTEYDLSTLKDHGLVSDFNK